MFTELLKVEYPKIVGEALGKYSAQYAHKLYELECGHLQDIKKQHAKTGKFRCKTCLVQKHESVAELNNLAIVDHMPTSDPDYKLYKFIECGHEQLFASYNIKFGVKCTVCTIQSRFDAASRNNLELLNADCTDKWMHRNYKYKKCNHVQSIKIQDVENDNVPECRQCRQDKWVEDALSVGLVFIGESETTFSNNGKYYKYEMPCGCIKDFKVGNIKRNVWACDLHSNFWNKKSNVYVIKFTDTLSGFSWLKVGVSTNVQKRISDYKLKSKCKYDILFVKEFDSYKEALAFEKRLHSDYKDFNLDHSLMKKYKQNGWSECYTLDISSKLLSELRKTNE
jgi:hypothetical protein